MSPAIRAVFLFGLTGLPFLVFGQDQDTTPTEPILITGGIIEPTSLALPNASVTASTPLGKLTWTLTDSKGRFALAVVPSEEYELRFEALGYSRKTIAGPKSAVDLGAVTLNPAQGDGRTVSELVEPALCELVKEPEHFNGEFVAVRAKVVTILDEKVLVDESCSAHVLLETSDPHAPRRHQYESVRPGLRPISLFRGEEFKTLGELLENAGSHVFATMAGRFDHVDRGGFGNRGLWDSQLAVQNISGVESKAIR